MSQNPPKIDPAFKAMIYSLDPTRHFEVIKDKNGKPYYPDVWQKSALVKQPKGINTIIVSSRQAGKSTVISVKAGNKACYTPGALVLVLAPVERQARELYLKIKQCIKATPGAPAIVRENAREIELANGSRIVCLPGKAEFIAGYSAPDLVIIDEACYAKDNLYNTVSPMMAVSSGELVLISTPFISSGFFYEIWMDKADKSWNRIEITANNVARITQEFLDKERRRIGEWWFNSQYMCRFQQPEDSLFTEEMINNIFRDNEYTTLIKTGDEPLYTDSKYKAMQIA